MNTLHRQVLVLNRGRKAIGTTIVATALADVCRGQKRAIDTDTMRDVTWEEWITLPVREGDFSISTVRGPVRAPTVIQASSYVKMPKKRLKKNRRGVAVRDGYRCGYTGELCYDGSVDHVKDKAHGGSNDWTNLVWSKKEINHQKANRTPEQAGLKLLVKPFEPQPIPICNLIKPEHPDWRVFLE